MSRNENMYIYIIKQTTNAQEASYSSESALQTCSVSSNVWKSQLFQPT